MSEKDEYKGIIKCLVNDKRGKFGFIQVDGFPKNVFFHARSVRDSDFESLAIGQTLSFVGYETTDRGISTEEVYVN